MDDGLVVNGSSGNNRMGTVDHSGTVNPGYKYVPGYFVPVDSSDVTADMLNVHDVTIAGNGQRATRWHGTGQPPKTKAEKIAAIQAWDSMNDFDRPLLAEWLEAYFGLTPNDDLAVAESTFHGWRKLKKP